MYIIDGMLICFFYSMKHLKLLYAYGSSQQIFSMKQLATLDAVNS